MLNKVRLRLTFFCALVIGGVLLIMTCVCLAISESSVRAKNYIDFQTNTDSLLAYINEQSILSYTWLTQMEHNYRILIDIQNKDNSFLYSSLSGHEERQTVFKLARKIAASEYNIDPERFTGSHVLAQHETFRMEGQNGEEYYAMVALLPKNGSYLNIAILHSTSPTARQMIHQRFLFGGGALTAWICLVCFAWFFIQRMLRPIEENRRKQAQFIASASHELRSPLAVILSALSAAKIAEPDKRDHFFETIESEGKRMTRLVDDMLALANSDNRSWRIQPSLTEIDTLLLETYEKYEPQSKQQKLQFQIVLPEEAVPPVLLDRERIAQVLSILIDNAFSYTPAGGCIKLSLETTEKYAAFLVADNGPGIPDEQKEKIFDRFYRADDAHQDREHFGLGLCIAKEIVLLHHGKIQVSDAPDGGSVFTVFLPR